MNRLLVLTGILILILLAGCGGQSNITVMVIAPADLTATAVSVSQVIRQSDSVAAPLPTPDPSLCTAYNVLGAAIYLRNYPSAQLDMIATWLPGVPLEVLGRTDTGWYFLRIPPSGRGWVNDEVIRLSGSCDNLPVLASANMRSPDYKLPCRVSSATGNTLSLHSLPRFDSQIVGELPQGYLMESRQRTQGGWYYLNDFLTTLPQNWNQGWAYESDLHLNGLCNGLTTEQPPTNAAVILASGEKLATGCSGLNEKSRRVMIFANGSADSPLLSWVLPGETARVSLRNAQGWVMVEYDAFRGWVKPGELTLSTGCDQLPDLP
ncbi:MAG: SH3 domain-containing protein [Anaerolineae bacterium]|nr:SH3 domain-containing protein [Anaerolineae bacterium]